MIDTIAIGRFAAACGLIGMAGVVSNVMILMLHPLLRRFALARPNPRSSHSVPTPQGGGIAVVIATLGVTLAILWVGRKFGSDTASYVWPVCAATAFIALVGAVDDIYPIPIAPRLLLQMLCVIAVVAALPEPLRVVPLLPFWIERVLLVLAGVWFVNLVNFMDGIDWMTVSEVVPVAIGLALLAQLSGDMPAAVNFVALALCGAMLGFAPLNRPVARLFLGDVGSLPIGLLLFWLLSLVAGSGHLAAALILPLYYLADAGLTLLRRIVNGEPFWQAHRTHFYQRATDRGFTVLEVVARVFAVNVVLVALACLTVLNPGVTSAIVALAVSIALVGLLLLHFSRGKK